MYPSIRTNISAKPFYAAFFMFPFLLVSGLFAQEQEEEDIYEISPFVIEDDTDIGYLASQTMAGGRLRTDLRNVGSSIQVVTSEFMEDIGATGIEDLLQYTTNTEVGGIFGNFVGQTQGAEGETSSGSARGNPDGTSRIRGLAAPDRTRNFYKTNIPFDVYNTDRIDINRGANSFLFGLGSPAGLINNGMARAHFEDRGEVQFRVGSGGERPSWRVSGNYNKVLVEDMVAVRVAFLNDATQYRQLPTFKDDQRLYTTATIQPFRNPNTVLRAYFETGSINGNAPDTLSPQENLSTFLNDPVWGQRSIDGMANLINFNNYEAPVNERNSRPDRNPEGLPLRDSVDADVIRDIRFAPAWGFIYDGQNGTSPTRAVQGQVRGTDIVSRDPFYDPRAPNGKNTTYIGLFPGNYGEINGVGYVDQGLTDLETFDFSKYNLGWDNDYYTRDFDNFNIALEQVLFNGNAGFEVGYDFQELDRSDYQAMNGAANVITFDINRSLPYPQDINYLETGNVAYETNPNFGRPVAMSKAGFRDQSEERETFRFTGFLKHSFKDQMDESFLGRMLGSHTLTVLYDDYSEASDFVPYTRASFGDPHPGFHLGPANAQIATNNNRNTPALIYLGPPQLDAFSDPNFSLSDFVIEPAKYNLHEPAGNTYDILYWDLGPEVNHENFGRGTYENGNESWKYGTFAPVNVPNKNVRKQLTEVESFAINSQSFILDDLLVVNMGWRHDEVTDWLLSGAPESGWDEIPDLSEDVWNLDDVAPTEVESEIFGYGGVLNWPHRFIKLPDSMDIAIHYNQTENFVPSADRVDQYRDPIPAPTGSSKDWGITLFLFDNKVVSRFNWYDAKLANATASVSNTFNQINSNIFTHWGNLNRDLQEADANRDGVIDEQFFVENPPELLNEGEADERLETRDEVIERLIPNFADAGPAHASVTPILTPELKEAYNFRINQDGSVSTQWAGTITDTQDIQSKGFEWELVMNPTNNWRVSLNFADTETILTNFAPRLTELVEGFWEPHIAQFGGLDWNDPMGPVNGNTTAEQVNNRILEYQAQKAQEGSPQLEQRRYRVNLVTNCRFSEGFLQGFSVGGAVRWQSNNAIGYPIIEQGGLVIPDISNPWMNENVYNADLTFGYRTKIGRNINYIAQINLRNVNNLDSDNLSSVRAQPTGQIARVRYDPPFQILLTNTFRF